MAELLEGQWELGGLVFGRAQPVEVTRFEIPGADISSADLEIPGEDGRRFGYDYRGGLSLQFEMAVNAEDGSTARAAWNALANRWRNPAVRHTPRAVEPLRIRDYGMDTVVVYGRPREFDAADTSLLDRGTAALTGAFVTADDRFYSDIEHTITLDLLPLIGDGLILPFTLPAVLTPLGDSDSAQVDNAGDVDTWPVITFSGPVTNPGVRLAATGAELRLLTTLAFDQTATLDTRPWARTARRSDGASLAGALSGPRMGEFSMPPGATEVAFRGQDPTGAARCTIRWRDARSTP
ncbi:phage tail family protein [Streptomonospora wellingtoniae]|uniref:Uncharacterized protein n=1 Tax=Streptomonospora wellingtoniae TaxID=3075544 RepID=A0ABU2KUH0_9ACTN|nr:hypothetical protein [Streptomonospora sp. DSM 45055]MDT0302895.1 hypothetical protein [Streptomonospora sp. DSM 45055]